MIHNAATAIAGCTARWGRRFRLPLLPAAVGLLQAATYTSAGFIEWPATAQIGALSSVAVSGNHIYVLHRGEPPILEFDKKGTYQKGFGEGLFKVAHGLRVDPTGAIWTTDNGNHVIRKFSPDGKLLLTLGEVNVGGAGPDHFRSPDDIVISSKGLPFYVEFGANKVASIDPQTMVIREWTLPNADSRPRRLAIDANDVIWYSDYSRGFLGRLDPATGTVSEWPSPGGRQAQPYGIAVINGMVWYSESGVQPNTVVRFDPKTEPFQTWKIPSGGGVVRNVSVTKEGNLVLAESGVNKIALVEIGR